jgi:hypothetical protein
MGLETDRDNALRDATHAATGIEDQDRSAEFRTGRMQMGNATVCATALARHA